jgi:hypothetical protein
MVSAVRSDASAVDTDADAPGEALAIKHDMVPPFSVCERSCAPVASSARSAAPRGLQGTFGSRSARERNFGRFDSIRFDSIAAAGRFALLALRLAAAR